MIGKAKILFLKLMAVVGALAISGTYIVWKNAEAAKANQAKQPQSAEAPEKEKRPKLIVGSKSIDAVLTEEITREELEEILEARKDSVLPIPGIPRAGEEVLNIVPSLPGSKSIGRPVFTKEHIKRKMEGDDSQALPELEADPEKSE